MNSDVEIDGFGHVCGGKHPVTRDLEFVQAEVRISVKRDLLCKREILQRLKRLSKEQKRPTISNTLATH
jgi:hypothetical protein